MTFSSTTLSDRTTRYVPEDGRSWRSFAEGLVDDPELRRALTAACGAHGGIFWECVPTARAVAHRPFAFVAVHSPAVAALRPDPSPFRPHLVHPVATFDNLGHDAVLVAPGGAEPTGCAHLASWCRTAPEGEQHAFWQAVGAAVLAWWERTDAPVWVSTSGLGVSWLHVRLDQRPKYITHRPYLQEPQRSSASDAMGRSSR